MQLHQRRLGWLLIAAAAYGLTPRAWAIDIVLDYRYDTTGFFDTGTVNGQKARATVEAAASFFSDLIMDSLDAIPYTDPTTPNAGNYPVWRQVITHPGTGQTNYSISSAANASEDGLTVQPGYSAANEFRDVQVPANQFLIYVGGGPLAGEAGRGGTGVAYYGLPAFNALIDQRGKPEGSYSTWGGYVQFDSDGTTNWLYDYTQPATAGFMDLYSVALHEIGHTLGLNGNSAEWNNLQVGSEWRGEQALYAWKTEDPSASPSATGIPTVSTTNHHWLNNQPGQPFTPAVRSYILGTHVLQETAMDPTLTVGTRKLMTNVDLMALRDIGWIIPPEAFWLTALDADFNVDTFVNAADLAIWKSAFTGGTSAGDADQDHDTDGADLLVWQRQLGSSSAASVAVGTVPEPGSSLLGAIAGWVLYAARRRKHRA